MFRMVLEAHQRLLVPERCANPEPGPGQVRLRVAACGVCRTDLHIVDGELPPVRSRVTPGHQVVGRVDAIGPNVQGLQLGDRLGVGWLGGVCSLCRYCREGEENLCDHPVFTGWTQQGGYADTMLASADFCFPLPDTLADEQAAPLLCAGLIGFRAWRKAAEARPVKTLGLYGFGAAAHLLAQLAKHQGQDVYAFTRPGDMAAQELARGLGCVWAGDSGQRPPEALDAAIIFAPAGDLVPCALQAVRKGGTVVCGGIHMSDIPAMPYRLLWEERRVVSVANLTRQDARDYFPLAAAADVRPQITTYALEQANMALDDLRSGRFAGAAVLRP